MEILLTFTSVKTPPEQIVLSVTKTGEQFLKYN